MTAVKGPKYVISRSEDKTFSFTLMARNGRTIVSHNGYKTKQQAKAAIESIKKNADSPIEDTTVAVKAAPSAAAAPAKAAAPAAEEKAAEEKAAAPSTPPAKKRTVSPRKRATVLAGAPRKRASKK